MELKRKIRVLEAIRQGKVGGGESHLVNVVTHLNRDVFEPAVLSFTHGKMIQTLEKAGVPVFVIPCETQVSPLTWYRVYCLLVKERIDIIHIHGTRANLHIVWAAKLLHIPIIYSVHGWSFHDDQSILVRRMRILFERFATRCAARTISVSYSNQQTGYQHIPGFKSVVIPNGIDLQFFHPGRPFSDLRREWGIRPDHCVIGFVARMTAQKGPLILIQAFAQIAKEHPKAFLLLVGEGELKNEAVRLTERLGVADRVVFEKFRTDVPDVLHAMDIFCLPSLWEGLPIGMLEAMAMARPSVATAVDGSREIIIDGENGLLVQPRNTGELAAALERLIADKALRDRIGKAARETVEGRFEVAHMTHDIEEQYLKTLKARKKEPTAVESLGQMKYVHSK